MQTRLIFFVVGMQGLAAMLAACGKSAPPPPPAPYKFELGELGNDFKMVDPDPSRHGQGSVHAEGLKWMLLLENFNPTTKYEVVGPGADVKGEVDPEGSAKVLVDVADKLPGTTAEELEKLDLGFTLKIELAGRTGEIKLPPARMITGVAEALKKLEQGTPVRFGDEPDDPNKADSLLWIYIDWSPKWIGKQGKLTELDWVANNHRLPVKGTVDCTGYEDDKGNPVPDFKLQLKDTEAVIYDRRTGAVVEKKVFPADPKCPQWGFKVGDGKAYDSEEVSGAIEEWLKSKLAARQGG